MNESNLDERLAEPGEDDVPLYGIEISFGLETWVTPDQQRSLVRILEEIAAAPVNTPKEGVHWLGFSGGKLNFSTLDCAMLGKAPGPNPPANGEEPTCDTTILCFETYARGFTTEKERERVLEKRRPSEFTCPQCGGHSYGTKNPGEADPAKRVRYCNGRGQRGKMVEGKFIPLEGPDEPRVRCDFVWPESEDTKYGLKPL